MLFRISLIPLVTLAFSALTAFSAPVDVELSSRQIGNLQCNIDRAKIITAVALTKNDVEKLGAAGSSDPAVTAAACEALSGLDNAEDGIGTILKALVRGQKAPPAARDQVGQGLTTTFNALNSINSTNPAVTSALGKAKKDLNTAIDAGNGVVTNCK